MPNIKIVVWNMEWLNDLFTDGPAFHPDDREVRGPHPDWRQRPTVLERRTSLSGVLNEVQPDLVVCVEGPNKAGELQLLFDTDVGGDWVCDVQPTKRSSQLVGLAVRTDTNKFDDPPFSRFHVGEGQGGDAERLSLATAPFLLDTDDDDIQEQHKFERLPLYAQVNTVDDKAFRILGLHLKSKGIFDSLEWSKWWSRADANRKKIVAQCRQLRAQFLDHYLTELGTATTPLIVCGDINDGPGMDASERRLNLSGVEQLMGTVWKPELTLGNALYDALDEDERREIDLDSIYTTSFRDPIFGSYRRVWIDHLLYSKNRAGQWLVGAKVQSEFSGPTPDSVLRLWVKFPHASDHFPIVATVDTAAL